MTETLGYSLSEVVHTLTTNRPSAIMASYHLLLSKLNRNQRGAKASKVSTSSHIPEHCETLVNTTTSIMQEKCSLTTQYSNSNKEIAFRLQDFFIVHRSNRCFIVTHI